MRVIAIYILLTSVGALAVLPPCVASLIEEIETTKQRLNELTAYRAIALESGSAGGLMNALREKGFEIYKIPISSSSSSTQLRSAVEHAQKSSMPAVLVLALEREIGYAPLPIVDSVVSFLSTSHQETSLLVGITSPWENAITRQLNSVGIPNYVN